MTKFCGIKISKISQLLIPPKLAHSTQNKLRKVLLEMAPRRCPIRVLTGRLLLAPEEPLRGAPGNTRVRKTNHLYT